MTAAQGSCAVLPWVALLSVQSGAACARRCRVPWTQVCSCEARTSAGTAGSPDVSPDAQLWQRPSWDLRVQPSQQSGSSGRPAPRRLPVSPDPFGGAAVARESRLAHVFACRGRVPRSIPPPLAVGAALAACSPLAGRPGGPPRRVSARTPQTPLSAAGFLVLTSSSWWTEVVNSSSSCHFFPVWFPFLCPL